jgi:ribosomal protein L11 methyltransferase
MPWLQMIVDIGNQDPQPIETALFAIGALAVTLHDAADQPVLEPAAGETPLWKEVRLVALFDEHAARDAICDQLRETLNTSDLPAHRFESLDDRDWEREWLKDFQPMRFGDRLWVCPNELSIEDNRSKAQDPPVIVRLDPGLAFGTGTHPTTALCLTWLDQADLRQKTVIDYGCGSGILAVAAAKLGAGRVIATDIDKQALQATHDNASHNGVLDQIDIMGADSQDQWHCDILLANILADTLIELASEFAGMLNTAGTLVMSGILDAQADTVVQTYSQWFDMLPFKSADGWSLLSGLRVD